MKVLAVVPARGGSKGVPRKNIREVAGRPLIAWTLAAALEAKMMDRVIVSTDDEEVAAVARAWGAEVPFRRPSELATDQAPTLAVLQHAVAWLAQHEGYRPDAVLTLQPTSPLRRAAHCDEAIAVFSKDPNADSLVSCIAVPHILHPRSVMRMTDEGYLEPFVDAPLVLRRQDKGPVFARNGAAIYITRTERLSEYVFGGRLLPFVMDENSSLDVDTEDDLKAADAALRQRAAEEAGP